MGDIRSVFHIYLYRLTRLSKVRLNLSFIISTTGVMTVSEELNEQMLVRRNKLNVYREKGIDPFGGKFIRTH